MRKFIGIILTLSLLLALQACGINNVSTLKNEFVSLVQTDGDKSYLNVFDLITGELVFEKKLGNADDYFYGMCDVGKDYNIISYNTNEIYEITNKGVSKLATINRNIVFSAMYKEKLLVINYDNSEKLHISVYDIGDMNNPIAEKKLDGKFSDCKLVADKGEFFITTYSIDDKFTSLYVFNLIDNSLFEKELFNYATAAKVTAYNKSYWIAVGEKLINTTKKVELNKIFKYTYEDDIDEFAQCSKNPFIINSDANNIYYIEDKNNPHLYVINKNTGKPEFDFSLSVQEIYGLKVVNNNIYIIGSNKIYNLKNGKLKLIIRTKYDNIRAFNDIF